MLPVKHQGCLMMLEYSQSQQRHVVSRGSRVPHKPSMEAH